jgi:glycosyltransferase involved in cell wall biosynthesis
MKIGFDAKRTFFNRAGLGNYSRNVLNALSLYYPQHQYYLYSPRNKQQLYYPGSNQQVILPQNGWRKFPSLWRSFKIASLTKKHKLDIYHGLSHELPTGIQHKSCKTVVTIHDLIFIRYPEFYRFIDRQIYFRKFKQACRNADKVIAISEQTKSDIQEFFHIEESKIEVIYQPIHQRFFNPILEDDAQMVRCKYQLPIDFILSVGTIERRKNLLSILEAMVTENLDYPLLVIGRPTSYINDVKAYIAKHPNLKVIFLHDIADDELNAIYRMAKILIYPSVFEGFGLPVAEALACGTPVITSNISSMPEAGGDAAILIQPDSAEEIGLAMRHLLSDNDFYQRKVEESKIQAQQFTPAKAAKQLIQLYKSIL